MRSRVRTGLRGVGLLAVAGALCAAIGTPAYAAPDAGAARWQPDLAAGQGSGAVVDGGSVRFDPATAHGAPAGDADSNTESSADPSAVVPTGLFTLPGRTLDRPTSEVASTLDATVGPGSTAELDVRGKRAGGGWTEWVPSTPGAAAGSGVAELPEPVREVQGRLVLTSTGDDRPSVRGVTLTAAPSTSEGSPQTEAAPLSYSVFATREGLVGGTTANGHKIANRDRFVALPSRRALSPNGRSDYSVKVCAPNGRCAFAPVWDIGPWNTKDDYWNPGPQRQQFGDLPQGVPQAQAAFRNGHNGGKDGFGRRPSNPAGIDLGDGIFWDALGLKDNSQVQVDYLWTGNVRLSKVTTGGDLDTPVRSAPDAKAEVVGVAADSADVPVQCREGSATDGWVRVGAGQFVAATTVEGAADAPACGAAGATAPNTAAGQDGTAAAQDGTAPTGTARKAPATGSATPGAAAAPDTAAPDTAALRSAAPGTTAPGTTAPGSAAPGSAAPDAAAPGTSAPGTSAPSTSAPADPTAGDAARQAPATSGTPPVETGTHQSAGTTGSSSRARSGA